MFAYFIGGPWDLTKRAIKASDLLPYFVAEPHPRMLPNLHNEQAPEAQRIDVIRHEYRRRWYEGEYVIYIYEGIR